MAYKYATEDYCRRLGNIVEVEGSNKLILKGALDKFNCKLIDSPSKQYTATQCILQKDIQRSEKTVVNVHGAYTGSLKTHVGVTCLGKVTNDPSVEGYDIESYGYDVAMPDSGVYSSTWPQFIGGSVNTETQIGDHTIYHTSKVIFITQEVILETDDYYESDDFVGAFAAVTVAITYSDGEIVHTSIRSDRFYRQLDSKNGKYRYEITFKLRPPFVTTKNKPINVIDVSLEFFSHA